MQKVTGKQLLSLFFSVFVLIGTPAFAGKQKYTRTYQEKNVVVQKKSEYYQKKDMPYAQAYLEVSRKKPEVKVEYQQGEVVFQTDQEKTSCEGAQGMGCTRFSVHFQARADCDTSVIVLKAEETTPLTVEISSKYPKETCEFDAILKHELAHAAVYRKTLSSFLNKTGQDLILEYERLQQESKRCEHVEEQISQLAAKANADYSALIALENAKLDAEDGTHPYGLEQCVEPGVNE